MLRKLLVARAVALLALPTEVTREEGVAMFFSWGVYSFQVCSFIFLHHGGT